MALDHAVAAGEGADVTIITDSKSSIQALLQPVSFDNINLHTSILAAQQQLQRQQRSLRLVWTPSHIGVAGNEAADRAANEGLSLPRPTINVVPTISALKANIFRRCESIALLQHRAEVIRQSKSATWYQLATEMQPPPVTPFMPRQLTTAIHRLRLGFPCWDNLNGNLGTCQLCGETTEELLLHYILQCPTTDSLRQLVPHQENQRLFDRREAALMVNRLLTNGDALKIIIAYSPPR